jgi:HD domain
LPSAVTVERPGASHAPQTTPEQAAAVAPAQQTTPEHAAAVAPAQQTTPVHDAVSGQAPQTERAAGAGQAPTRPAQEPGAGSLRGYLAQVVLATSLVALCPMLIVWWLRSSGMLTTYVLGTLLGIGLSLGAAQVGRALWQTRPGSQHLLFSELMIWGFIRRCYSERRLTSARAVLGSMNHAQLRVANGLSADDQTKRVEALAKALDASDPNTHGHSRRVARYSWMIATRMGLPREQVARIRTAAAVHDVGKIKTPHSVLRKAGALTDEEYKVMKRHAADGARMAAALNDVSLTKMVLHHHERMDGSGYPSGLAGDDIPLGARIIAVADTFDSMTANRPYRTARTHKEAIDVLLGEAGTKLDAGAVRAFCGHYSGRRPLTFWASLTTLPERLIAQFGGGVIGAASAAKALTVAAIVGGLAAGTASLARPAHSHAQRIRPSSAAARLVAAGAAQTAGSGAGGETSIGAPAGHRVAARQRGNGHFATAHRPGTPATPQGSSALSTAAGDAQSASETPSASQERGAAPTESGRVGSSGGERIAGGGKPVTGGGGTHEGSSREVSGHETSSSHPEEHRVAPEQSKGTTEGTQAKGEASKSSAGGVVGETVGKVEEVKGKAVEEVKGKVEEVKGKVEEVKSKAVEEVKGKTEELTGKTIGEVKSKTEEVTGKAKEVLGKL